MRRLLKCSARWPSVELDIHSNRHARRLCWLFEQENKLNEANGFPRNGSRSAPPRNVHIKQWIELKLLPEFSANFFNSFIQLQVLRAVPLDQLYFVRFFCHFFQFVWRVKWCFRTKSIPISGSLAKAAALVWKSFISSNTLFLNAVKLDVPRKTLTLRSEMSSKNVSSNF